MSEIGKFKLSDAIPKPQKAESEKDRRRTLSRENSATPTPKPSGANRAGVSRRRIGDA